MHKLLIVISILLCEFSDAQTSILTGLIRDGKTKEPLAGASIILWRPQGLFGGMSNAEGRFTLSGKEMADSIRISVIGYRSRSFKAAEWNSGFIVVDMERETKMLEEVVVQPLRAEDLIRKAEEKIPSFMPMADFEGRSFYRETIRDSLLYYAVSEAIFRVQFHVKNKSYRFSLDRGRSKEDVAYTRLFEDFHPGGGPEDALDQNLLVRRPSFLDPDKMKYYQYKKDSVIRSGDQNIFIISFDQKPGLHESLEKGRVYISGEDYAVLKYECRNSPLGTPYIKSLSGTDKIFAEILHIDFKIKGWAKSVSFEKLNGKLYLSFSKMDYFIDYRQPKKNLNMNLAIHTELLMTEFNQPLTHEIARGEEWKRKNLVANLPSDFDSAFWGGAIILDPTVELKQIISSIDIKNKDTAISVSPDGWSLLNRPSFIAEKKVEGMRLIPVARSSWDDELTGGLLYQNKKGDFSLETRLQITKRTDPAQEPDNGFQQSGIMIRSADAPQENNIQLCLGTGGSSTAKYFLKNTINGKTRSTVDKIAGLHGWLRMEKRKDRVMIFWKPEQNMAWVKLDEYQSDWLSGNLQIGFCLMARFAGDGPRQRPDMQAQFSDVQIIDL